MLPCEDPRLFLLSYSPTNVILRLVRLPWLIRNSIDFTFSPLHLVVGIRLR